VNTKTCSVVPALWPGMLEINKQFCPGANVYIGPIAQRPTRVKPCTGTSSGVIPKSMLIRRVTSTRSRTWTVIDESVGRRIVDRQVQALISTWRKAPVREREGASFSKTIDRSLHVERQIARAVLSRRKRQANRVHDQDNYPRCSAACLSRMYRRPCAFLCPRQEENGITVSLAVKPSLSLLFASSAEVP
jgi:hypothetical protein